MKRYELGDDNRQHAYAVLRATLHALRARLCVDPSGRRRTVFTRYIDLGTSTKLIQSLPNDLRILGSAWLC